MDCLLLHVPKYRHKHGPYGDAMLVNFVSVGLLSMGNLLRSEGFAAGIVHTGLERLADPGFSLSALLQAHTPKVIGLSLVWHHQCADTIDAAREAKQACPDAFVVLGGPGAAAFAEEIVRDFPFVDGVVVGEGEVPLLSLVQARHGTGRLEQVPNLVWRNAGQVQVNSAQWCATAADLARFNVTDHSGLAQREMYRRLYAFMFPLERKALNRMLLSKRRTGVLFIPLGRGCLRQCAWCGGGAMSTTRLSHRTDQVLAEPAQVVEQAVAAQRDGWGGIATSFGGPGVDALMCQVLDRCRQAGLRPRWRFDSWELPSPELIREFSAAACPESAIELSPEVGSNELRGRWKGSGSYSNDDLVRTLEEMERCKVNSFLHFICGLPQQDGETQARVSLLKRVRRFRHVRRIQIQACELEPMSPMFLNPGAFGIERTVSTFADYVRAHRRGFMLGYTHSGLTEEAILARCGGAFPAASGRWRARLERAVGSRPALDPFVVAAGRLLWHGDRYSPLYRLLSPGAR